MIRNIFIPERVGSYYLFSKRIVGFDIERTIIYATVITASGYNRTIERFVEERIENDSSVNYQERVSRALQALMHRLGKFDAVYSALSSSLIVFKEITLPFISMQKIKMVAPFEVESMLPFALDQAVIDTIITRENKQINQADILVAAVKKEYIQEHITIFKEAGMRLDKITVDMFELYGLYRSIPAYSQITDTVALIDISLYTTRLAIVVNGQLKYIRALPKGLVTIAKKINATNKLEVSEIINHLLKVGYEDLDIARQALQELVNELQFTIVTYTSKLTEQEQIKLIVLTGAGSEVPHIAQLFKNSMHVETDILYAKKIIHNGTVASKTTRLPNSFLVSLATALSSPLTYDFNLQKLEANKEEEAVVNKQLIALITLTLLVISSFLTYSFLRVRSLRNAYNTAHTEAVNKLKTNFQLSGKAKTLKTANREAEESLRRAEQKWSPLSHKNRFSFLKYLYELSRHINRQELGLDLNSITMNQDEITLTGKVKDQNAVNKLEEQLKSNLFTLEESLQIPEFRSKPIRLKINKAYQEE